MLLNCCLGTIAKITGFAGLGLLISSADAAVFEVRNASADTTLIGIAPTNNNGAQQWVIAGSIQIPPSNPFRNRGLFKFDFTDLPTNTVIQAVALKLEVTRVPDEAPSNATFGLHRMYRPWGEGDNVAATYPGQGSPANPGGATWFWSFAPTNSWFAPGGVPGLDFANDESSFQYISGLGSYTFDFTPELAADVQFWVNQPEFNYGWILMSNSEDVPWNARRFGSREDPDNHPRLEISYIVPPLIDAAQRVSNSFRITFTPWPGQGYAVQFRNSLTNGLWQTLTNLGVLTNATPVVVTDSIALPQRFYRVLGY